MKVQTFFSSFVFICLLLLCHACQKEALIDNNALLRTKKLNESNYTSFVNLAKTKMLNGANLRTGTTYTLSESLELLNHSLNLAYCRPDENHAGYISVWDSLMIPVDTSSLAGEDDLADLFEEIATMAGNFFHGQSDTFKQAFNFEIFAYDNLQSGGLPVIAVFTMGIGQCGTLNAYPYQSSDQWEIFPEAGNCYTSSTSSDALDHWRCDLNANLNYRDKFNPYYYFTDRYSICFSVYSTDCDGEEIPYPHLFPDESYYGSDLLFPGDPTPNDNFYDYVTWFNTTYSSNYHTCLSQGEMNFYYQKQAGLSNYYKPSGKNQGKHEVGFNVLYGAGTTTLGLLRVDYFNVNELESEIDADPLPCPDC